MSDPNHLDPMGTSPWGGPTADSNTAIQTQWMHLLGVVPQLISDPTI